jgi:branched-chain amino acid transport system permease protein
MNVRFFLQSIVNAAAAGAFYAVLAVGLTLIFGVLRIVTFAHGYMYVLGGYVVVILVHSHHVNYFLALLIAAVLIGVFGIIIERIFFRPFRGETRALDSLIVSFGLALVLEGAALVVFGSKERFLTSPASGAVRLLGINLSGDRLVILIGGVLAIVSLLMFLRWTRTGQAMRAVAQDPVAASLQGVHVDRIYSLGFAIGSGLAAVGAGLILPISYLAPAVGSSTALTAFTVVVIGGLGSIKGALVGGLILGLVQTFGVQYLGVGSTLVGFVVIILILLIRPQGLFGHA